MRNILESDTPDLMSVCVCIEQGIVLKQLCFVVILIVFVMPSEAALYKSA